MPDAAPHFPEHEYSYVGNGMCTDGFDSTLHSYKPDSYVPITFPDTDHEKWFGVNCAAYNRTASVEENAATGNNSMHTHHEVDLV